MLTAADRHKTENSEKNPHHFFGGEDGVEKYDKNIRYRGSLQNYLIDTGLPAKML